MQGSFGFRAEGLGSRVWGLGETLWEPKGTFNVTVGFGPI